MKYPDLLDFPESIQAGGATPLSYFSVGKAPRKAASASRKQRLAKRGRPASPLQAAVTDLIFANGRTPSVADVKHVMESMSDAFSEGLALLDANARLVYVNESLCRMLGRAARELAGHEAAEVFGQLQAQPLERAHAGPDWYRCELQIAVGAKRRVIQMAAQPLRTRRGREIGCFAVFTDVTARAEVETALRRSESDLRLLSAQLIAAQELERQRIARELHDGIGAALAGVKCCLEIAEAKLACGDPRNAIQKVRSLGERVRGIGEEVRRIAMNLRPATLDDLGVLAALGWLFREYSAQHPKIKLVTAVEIAECDISPAAKTAIYRIVQEALNNVATHSRARNVEVGIKRKGAQLHLHVTDDGAGFEPGRFAAVDKNGRGLGLASMRERAEASGGRLIVQSGAACSRGGASTSTGTCVRASWPIHRERS